jgi:hypothetical protein
MPRVKLTCCLFFNTSETGALVFEVPATGDAALNGTIIDTWQVPLTDVGIAAGAEGLL